ncbi:MAG TPA: hypothetical protein VJO32_09750 [Ktedonobacteraceae bacterium]|nr:hypothetical protein [Ktedonobacteraceae bacterium]
MNFLNGSLWNTLLQILRDPIFALIFSIFLAILANRVVRRVIKTILYLGALAICIWLVTHNKSFADLCITIVHVIFNILLVLIIVLTIICALAIICVLIMFVISKPSPYRLRKLSSPWDILSSSQLAEGTYSTAEKNEMLAALATGYIDDEQARILLHEKGQRIVSLTQDFARIFEYLADDLDEDRPFKMITGMLHIYFSGLSTHMALIKKFHSTCNQEIKDLASILPKIFSGIDAHVQVLEDMARAKTFLPDKNEWQNLMDEADFSIPYFFLRLFCLHRNWKEVCTILYKGYCYVTLLDELKEEL